VEPSSGQTIYYWSGFEDLKRTVLAFPHHAYWQIGWITDYLLSEVHLRSQGKVDFPGGFITPKVGPHVSYGFAPGTLFGSKANLVMPEGLIKSDNSNVEYITALSEAGDKLYVLVLNQATTEQTPALSIDLSKLGNNKSNWTKETALQGKIDNADRKAGKLGLRIPAWGLSVVILDLAK
jgi:hypothetical protein